MKNIEYGGCLWFETSTRQQDYYKRFENNRVEVDSGRSAIQYIIEKYGYKRIWLPVYNCPLVSERIKKVSNLDVIFYNLNEDFSPQINLKHLRSGDVFLWVNYCGVMQDGLVDWIADMQVNSAADVIIDNIPAFFSEPRMEAFNIYSCRKFIGVPDGGYVIGNRVEKDFLQTYETAQNYLYLLKAIERGANAVYSDYQESEKRITEEEIVYGMPKLTRRILCNVDYEQIKETRLRNFHKLHDLLGDKNRIKVNFHTKTPSVYPYLTRNKGLRQQLLDNKVYISRFWKHILTNEMANNFEKDLAEYLIPLPIDQRYREEDMQNISEILKKAEMR